VIPEIGASVFNFTAVIFLPFSSNQDVLELLLTFFSFSLSLFPRACFALPEGVVSLRSFRAFPLRARAETLFSLSLFSQTSGRTYTTLHGRLILLFLSFFPVSAFSSLFVFQFETPCLPFPLLSSLHSSPLPSFFAYSALLRVLPLPILPPLSAFPLLPTYPLSISLH